MPTNSTLFCETTDEALEDCETPDIRHEPSPLLAHGERATRARNGHPLASVAPRCPGRDERPSQGNQ